METATYPDDHAHLVSLVKLIGASVHLLIQEYETAGHSIPALDSTIPGPFDTPESQTPSIRNAVETIEAACAQLCFSSASPGHVIVNVRVPLSCRHIALINA